MRKITFLVMGLVLALNLCACGCANNAPATTPTTTHAPTTNNTMMPTETMTVPVPETNIPDPDIGPTLPGGGVEGGNTTGNGVNNPTTGATGSGS